MKVKAKERLELLQKDFKRLEEMYSACLTANQYANHRITNLTNELNIKEQQLKDLLIILKKKR
jgi:hypothetical protein